MNILLVFVFALTAVGARGGHNPPNLQYMVKLEVSKAGQCSVCSGSFIDTHWILTTAHCVHGMDSVVAYIGPPFEGNCSTGYKINKNAIVIHELFEEIDHFVYHYDIALIKFTRKTSCGPIKPVQFLNGKPRTQFYRNESVAIVRLSSSCGQSPAPLSVHPVISDLHCHTEAIWGVFEGQIKDRMWCVSAIDYGGPCDGDTSSHLIMPNTEGELIGIMTNPKGENCGRNIGITPDIVFTDVYQFKSWITNKIRPTDFSSTQAMVKLNVSNNDMCSVCSGSFVHPNWILTSALCVHEANSVVVDVGRHFNSSCPASFFIKEDKIFIYSLFDTEYDYSYLRRISHDIALIKFIEETSCERNWIVRLPDENVPKHSYYDEVFEFTRFGESCNTSPPALSTNHLRVVDDDLCGSRTTFLGLGQVGDPLGIFQMCISTEQTEGSCIGDTSGHLFKRGNAELIGIMSRQSHQECSYNDRVTFTQVSKYVSWIRSHWTEIE